MITAEPESDAVSPPGLPSPAAEGVPGTTLLSGGLTSGEIGNAGDTVTGLTSLSRVESIASLSGDEEYRAKPADRGDGAAHANRPLVTSNAKPAEAYGLTPSRNH